MRRLPLSVFLSILILLLQTSIMKFLAIGTLVPDVVLLWIVYMAVREGQLSATVAGFLLGLALDLLAGSGSMLGLTALSKTVAGFLAGYFYNENKILHTLGSYQYILIVTVTSLVHNLIYFIIFLQGSDTGIVQTVVQFGLPATAYTAAAALIPMFAFARRSLT
jgi:rod shape-determining protein MreD